MASSPGQQAVESRVDNLMTESMPRVHTVPRLLVVGSYNASLTVFSDELPRRGQTVLGDQLDIGPGGKGNNQAIAARRLGVDVAFVVKLGRDSFGETARELLVREGLPPGLILGGKRGTGVALIM